MLKLVLDPVNKLTDEEMRKGGKAKITLATDVEAEGTFKCFRAGVGVNACITARGNFAADLVKDKTFVKEGEGAASAELTATLVRKVVLPAGESVAKFPGLVAASLDNVTPSTGTKDWLADTDHKDAGLKVTLGAPAEKATEVTVSVKDAVVAKGRFVDPNCNHPLVINPVGAVHIDACCQLKRLAGLKPNDHSFSIHVKDDPHAVVFSIDSDDKFDPEKATASEPENP
jgi:hypothetical protein